MFTVKSDACVLRYHTWVCFLIIFLSELKDVRNGIPWNKLVVFTTLLARSANCYPVFRFDFGYYDCVLASADHNFNNYWYIR